MDNQVTPKDILESHEEIFVEKQIHDDVFLFKLFDKSFLLRCPDREKPISRPSVYLYNDEEFDFPHVMLREEEIKNDESLPNGKYRCVCLYEQESIVYSVVSYEEKIFDAIDRLIELLSMTQVEREKEFQKEFMFYWNNASANQSAKVYLSHEDSFSRMSVYCSKSDTRYVEAGLELSDLNDREKKERKWLHHIENDVFFIPITDTREILPPYRGHQWTVDNVKAIVYGKQIDHISYDTYQRIRNEKVSTQDVILVFGMHGVQSKVTFAVKLRCKNTTNKTLFEKICDNTLSVEPICTYRKDYSYLCDQIGNDIGLRGKKILLIGGGSLGSYVAFELVKNGVSSLKVYDGDNLVDENVFRWAYGGLANWQNKANHLGMLLEFLHPEIRVEAIEKNMDINTLVEEMNHVDIIVFAIGSSDSQLIFNRALKRNQCHIPVIYTWLEAGGNYSHILAVDYAKQGCYECLYTNEQGELVNNRATLNENIDTNGGIVRNGCGGTRAAYGTAVLLRTTATLLIVLQKMLSKEINANMLIDITPENVSYSSQIVPVEACSCCDDRSE